MSMLLRDAGRYDGGVRLTLLIGFLAVAACRSAPPPDDGLVAVTSEPAAATLGLWRLAGGRLHRTGSLPPRARALRTSPDGRFVAWVEDRTDGERPASLLFLRGVDGRVAPLGPAAFRDREAFGLGVRATGEVLFVGAQAASGTDHVTGPGGEAWVDHGCLVVRGFTPAGPVCGDALRPLDVRDGRVVARTNASVIVADAVAVTSRAMTEVLDARFGPDQRLLVVRRANDGPSVSDELLVGAARGDLRSVLRGPILISARWARDGGLLVVRAEGDAMENLLEHAPDEFGGEALAGDAVRVDAATGAAVPVEGLEGRLVRALFDPR